MFQPEFLELAILDELAQVGTCEFQVLRDRLPCYSWNQVYSTVDRLTREGTVALKNPAPILCFVSLAPR